jgi:putative DNA primase/helicase
MSAARFVCWGFELGEEDGFRILWEHYNPRCVPPWTESELRKKCRDACDPAKADKPRGWLLDVAAPITSPSSAASGPQLPAGFLGSLASPSSARPTLPQVGQGEGNEEPPTPPATLGIAEDDPHRLARLYLANFQHKDGPTLRYWGGEFAVWREGAYDRLTDDEIRNDITAHVEREFAKLHAARIRVYELNAAKGDTSADNKKLPMKAKVSRGLVLDVIQALKSECGLPSSLNPPCWLCDGPPAAEMIATRSQLVHLPAFVNGQAEAIAPATPKFFTFNRVGFDFEADAPEPRQWLAFLANLWPNDAQSIACLQEWFGYLLTPDTRLHKMLLVIGPPRAGKGTIARVLRALVGASNVASPTLGHLAQPFGLADLVGKPVAMIADVRLSGRQDAVAITEELLSITGEDDRTVNRKHISALSTKLTTRFVLLSNQMPELGDASGALLSRFSILRLTRSFAGCEDTELLDKLLTELPGILRWAIAGWARLNQTGRFTIPESAAELSDEAEGIISPIRVFIRERIEIAEDGFVETGELYTAWVEWCKRRGRERIEHREGFIAKLRAALPTISNKRAGSNGNRKMGYSGIRLLSEIEVSDSLL